MGLLANLELAWQNREKIALIAKEAGVVQSAVKGTPPSGYGSSEFIAVVVAAAINVWNGLSGHPIPDKSVEIASILAGGYAALRTLLKVGQQAIAAYHEVELAKTVASDTKAPVAPAAPSVAVAVSTPPAA